MSRNVLPAKVLPINITSISAAPQTFDPKSTNLWPNNTDSWDIVMGVTQMPHSDNNVGASKGFWSGLDVTVGDWITTEGSGRTLQIITIKSATATKMEVIVVDKYRVNTLNDQTQNGDGGIQKGKGFLYSVVNAVPILYPLPDAFPGTISTMMAAQLVSRAFHVGGETGYDSAANAVQSDSAVNLSQPLGGGGGGGATQFTKLTDVPSSYGSDAGYYVRVNANANGLEFGQLPTFTTSFLKLTDAPTSYQGQANQFVAVNSKGTGLTFVSPPQGGGGSPDLGTPTTGVYDDGAIKGWVSGTTTISDAFYQTNKFLNYFVPVSPPNLSNVTLVSTDGLYKRDGHNILTATGIPSNCNYSLNFGTNVPFTGNTTITFTATGFGYDATGSLVAKLNGQTIGEIDNLQNGDLAGLTNGSLTITANYIYPKNDPISQYLAIDAKIVVTGYSAGLNELTLTCATGTSLINFVYDKDTAIATLTNAKIIVKNYGTLYYSSGIPHLTSSANISISITLSKWCSYGFIDTSILTINYNPPDLPPIEVGQGTYNVPSSFGVFAPDVSITGVPVAFPANLFGVFAMLFLTSKPLVDSTLQQYGPKLLIANGTPTNCIIEQGWVRNGITLTRCLVASSSSYPDMSSFTKLSDIYWDSGNVNSVGSSIHPYTASVIGGAVIASQDDYSSNYEPVNGPDLNSKNSKQYFDFYFQGILSEFTLTLVGDQPDSIAICFPNIAASYVMDPEFSQWFSGITYFNYPQGTWPGYLNAGIGCLYYTTTSTDPVTNLGSTTYLFTFGRMSSQFATDNVVIVRLGMSNDETINDIIVDF